MSELMRELSRKGSTTNEQSLLGGRENTTDLIKKSEKINTLVEEQVRKKIRLLFLIAY